MEEHPEFLDYIDRLNDEKMYREHEAWLHTTFLGRLTNSVLSWAKQSDFMYAIAQSFSNEDIGSNPYGRTIGIAINVGIIVVGVIALYSIGRIIQVFIGKEIIVEQKVIIETQVKLSDLMKDDEFNPDDDTSNVNNDAKKKEDAARRNKKSKVQ